MAQCVQEEVEEAWLAAERGELTQRRGVIRDALRFLLHRLYDRNVCFFETLQGFRRFWELNGLDPLPSL